MDEKPENTSNAPVSSKVSYGVEALIQRLCEDGVSAGREQAQEIISAAQREADKIISAANTEAQRITDTAKQEADRLQQGGIDALHIAMRDIVLKLKAKLSETVGQRVQQLISAELAREDFLQELIREVAGRARDDAKLDQEPQLKLLLPRELIGLEELRQHPLELEEGSLSHFILHVAGDVLREGVTFGESTDGKYGLRIYLAEKAIQVDLSDERICEVLLEHLQPRFRAVLEGTVK